MAARRYELSDAQWEQIKDMIPRAKTGRPPKDDRLMLNAMIMGGHPNSSKRIVKPENFDKMIEFAERLSMGIPHIRIDLYNINGKIYFGDYTFSHWSGMKPLEPQEWENVFGDWIHLPER